MSCSNVQSVPELETINLLNLLNNEIFLATIFVYMRNERIFNLLLEIWSLKFRFSLNLELLPFNTLAIALGHGFNS